MAGITEDELVDTIERIRVEMDTEFAGELQRLRQAVMADLTLRKSLIMANVRRTVQDYHIVPRETVSEIVEDALDDLIEATRELLQKGAPLDHQA